MELPVRDYVWWANPRAPVMLNEVKHPAHEWQQRCFSRMAQIFH